MKTITTTLCLTAGVCVAGTNDIVIRPTVLGNPMLVIEQPGKTAIGIERPVVLIGGSDFDLKFMPDRVEVRPSVISAPPAEYYYWPSTELKTNWVGLRGLNREIGLLIEETVATILHNGKANRFVLESKEVGTTGPRAFQNMTIDGFIVVSNLVWPGNGGSGLRWTPVYTTLGTTAKPH